LLLNNNFTKRPLKMKDHQQEKIMEWKKH